VVEGAQERVTRGWKDEEVIEELRLRAAGTTPQRSPVAPDAKRPTGSAALRRVLIALDVAAISLAWAIVFLPGSIGEDGFLSPATALPPAITVVGLWLMSSARLYRARVSSIRTVEATRLARISVILGLTAFAMGVAIDRQPRLREMAAGAFLTFALLVIGRGGYRSWLRAKRVEGRFSRPVVIVGINDETIEVIHLFEAHPELGFSFCGVVGERSEAIAHGLDEHWLGSLDEAVPAMLEHKATGAVLVATAVPNPALNVLCRDLLRYGGHVHLTSGLRGIDHNRLHLQPLAYEPFFYLEPVALSHAQKVLKRVVDLTITTITLTVVAPVLLAAAIAIKVQDGGPILFRQRRVGLDGKPFTIFKLRTMVVDAEARMQGLREKNERDGPLFKMDTDPRITRIGRLLRATSIDELPQLINVLRGEMSLVGPRPALPSEVAEFDPDLLSRTQVLPGITGLWQVEARDNPSFAAYRRLDLFYVENWSVTFDLVILMATVESEVYRILRRRPKDSDQA
jgi:exopolysaccharide biosynthesis polyprenyl glycosylphosphotransferase